MTIAAIALTNGTAAELAAVVTGQRVKLTRLVVTNRHATVPSSFIILDGTVEIARYHLAAAGGQINLGEGDPSRPIYSREKHTAGTALKMQNSVNQDGLVGHAEFSYS